MSRLRILPAFLALVALGGCSALKATDQINERAGAERLHGDRALDAFKDQVRDPGRARGQVVDLPWVAGRPQPLARDVSLPAALRANVNTTMLFEDGAPDLVTFAARIQLATGILTQVSPDALLPREYFLPRLGGDQVPVDMAAVADGGSEVLVPALVPEAAVDRVQGPALPRNVGRTKMRPFPAGEVPLSTVLDAEALRRGVYWRYDPEVGAIRIYRTETRTFYVKALELTPETSLELGLSGQGGSQNADGQFASQNRSKYSTVGQGVPADAVIAKVSQFLTRAGVVKAANGAANSIVVTDTKDALDAVGRFLEAENRIMSRSVRMLFEEITVQLNHTSQAALDWRLIYDSLGRANAAAGQAPGALLDSTKAAGALGATVGSGPFAGSKLLLNALNEMGTVVRHTTIPLLASNLRPATLAAHQNVPYIKDLQQTQSTSNVTAPTVTVTQDEKTVGTFLTVVPNAQDDGRVQLTVSYDDTRLLGALKKVEFGSPDYPSYVQQANIGGQGAILQVELRPGQVALIGGLEQSSGNSTRRRLDENAPIALGGSDSALDSKQITLLLMTAIPEEGF
ncbi:MAG: type II secretion system protein GspD [Achromobacter sp.]|uniref:type II secretion system protein GspD n=1 Tax=Achromobacter sp. TaxID=134375 RepID=UPI003D073FEE